MFYCSTRDPHKREKTFSEIVLEGLAPDRGLYIPKHIPRLESTTLERWKTKNYRELLVELLRLYAPELEDNTGCRFSELVEPGYSAFREPEVTALRRLGRSSVYIGELFHGPSYAFKDIALQLLGQILERLLRKQNRKLALLGATSGDTGAAAIYGVRGMSRIQLAVLHPHKRISEVQRKQMCSVLDANICNIALEGDFDACQSIVKTLLEQSKRDPNMPELGAINSINWGRILAQMSYYFALYFRAEQGQAKVRFVVPTGNFGNVLAGYFAKQMGLPIELVLATNHNDILHRCIAQGQYQSDGMRPSLAPAMDIVRPSNFERYLYYLFDEQTDELCRFIQAGANQTETPWNEAHQERLQRDFASHSSSDVEILQAIRDCYQKYSYLLDPHTACAYGAAWAQMAKLRPQNASYICLATAHPAKFPTVYRSMLEREALETPPGLRFADAPERCRVLEADSEVVLRYLRRHFWQNE